MTESIVRPAAHKLELPKKISVIENREPILICWTVFLRLLRNIMAHHFDAEDTEYHKQSGESESSLARLVLLQTKYVKCFRFQGSFHSFYVRLRLICGTNHRIFVATKKKKKK